MITVLIVEDELDLAQLLSRFISEAGMNPHVLSSGATVTSWVRRNTPDIVLLDIMLPDKNGIDICNEVREFSDVPIIMTTAKVEEADRLQGFDIGANDYICKPYSAKEVIARIKNLINICHRNRIATNNQDLILNEHKMQVIYKENSIELSNIEFKLLSLLYLNPSQIFTREQVIERVYQDYRIISDRTVDSHIKNLRKKLASLNGKVNYIKSIYGAGYKFEGAG